MSKERKLLGVALDFLDPRRWLDPADQHVLNILTMDIEELLAQPEQNEPVAWCQMVKGKVQDLLSSFEMKDWLYDKSWMPLYTSPPKREPLSEAEIFNAWIPSKATPCVYSFKAGVRFAEKGYRSRL